MDRKVKLKDPGTCRIFFSSPFGGMEEEREELTKKYFPQIHHACNAKGIKFVPVDMRWGITKEAADNAQVMNICLREVSRSDFFVGFFGQRYGWHSAHSDDSVLLENFEKALDIHPWVEQFKDRSMTEIEFRAGHLNNPGCMPACFCFREKDYDDMMKAEGEKNNDSYQVMKFTIENEYAAKMRSNLIQELVDTQDKTWGVKLECKDPQEMAKFMFDSLWKYLNEVVLVDLNEEEVPYFIQQRVVHDQFISTASHIYCGCEDYLDQLMSRITGPPVKGTVVTGPAGCGKSALLARWMQLLQQAHPYVTIVYHFIGCAPGTERPRIILERILLELRESFPELKTKTPAPGDTAKTKVDSDKKDAGDDAKTEEKSVDNVGDTTEDSKAIPVTNGDSDPVIENNESSDTKDEDDKDENCNKKLEDDQKVVIEDMLPIASVEVDKLVTNIGIEPIMASDVKSEEDDKNSEEDKKSPEDKTNSGDKDKTGKDSSSKNSSDGDQKMDKKEKKSGLENKSTQQILSEVTLLMKRITEEGHKVVIILDALNQQKIQDKNVKHLYWLPETFPEGVSFVCSTLDSDSASHDLLLTERAMEKLVIQPFDSKLQEQICVETLKVAGKELSPHQLERVIHSKETSNALFLKLVLYELSIYGSFSKLDNKIDSLINVSGVKLLLQVILERLETDYCSTDYNGNLVKDVLCCLIASRRGLSESELTEILNVPAHLWSPLFFALEHLLSQYTGLLGFAFSEMREAVVERYLTDKDQIIPYKRNLIKYFDNIRKTMRPWIKNNKPEFNRLIEELPWHQIEIDDKEALIETLSDLSILRKIGSNNCSELLYLWQKTGLPWSSVTNLYMAAFDKSVADLYEEKQNGVLEETDSPGMKLRVTLSYMRMFFSEAYYAWGSQKAMEREIRVLETCKSSLSEEKRAEYLRDARYYLAMSYADQQDSKRALPMYMTLNEECEKLMKDNEIVKDEVKEMMAFSCNGIGLIHYHLKENDKAIEYLKKSKEMHKEMAHKMHEGASTTNLGLVYLDNKDFNTALEYFDEAKQLYEDYFFGKISIDIGNLYTNIALTHRRMKNLDKAEEFYHKSLEMKAMNVGWNHPVIATAYMNLGTLEVFRKNYKKAEEWTRKAISIYETNEFPKTDRSHRMCRENLCVNMLKQGKKKEVLPLYIEISHILVDNNWMDELIVSLHREMLEYMIEEGMYTEVRKFVLAILASSKRRSRFAHILADCDSKWPPQRPRPYNLTLGSFLEEYPKESLLKILYVNTVLAKKNSLEEIIEICHQLHAAEKNLKESAYSFAVEALVNAKNHESAWKLTEIGLQKYPDDLEILGTSVPVMIKLDKMEEIKRCVPIMLDGDMNSVDDSALLAAATYLKESCPLLAGKCYHKLATESAKGYYKKNGQQRLDNLYPQGLPSESECTTNENLQNKENNQENTTGDTSIKETPNSNDNANDPSTNENEKFLSADQSTDLIPSHQAMSESKINATPPDSVKTENQIDEITLPILMPSEKDMDPSQNSQFLFPSHQAMDSHQIYAKPPDTPTAENNQPLILHQGVSEGLNVSTASENVNGQINDMLIPHQSMDEGQNIVVSEANNNVSSEA